MRFDERLNSAVCHLANRFHQNIYYKIDGDAVVVWRILDQRFNPRRIELALTHPEEDL